VASWIARRTDYGSYHTLCDSDSILSLVAPWNEAFHDATGSNPHSFGISAATRADIWPLAPKAWRDGCIHNMAVGTAVYATWLRDTRGILIPARRITRGQSEDRIPGFISHAERDPDRRTDPGRFFPWDQFLDEYSRLIHGAPTTPKPPIRTSGGTVPVSLPILQVGNRSGAVRSLQTLLITKAGQRIAADGVFGPRTRDAVLNVQRYFRLTPDGIVGAKTWPTLFL
jgi:hypothetical protein